ncbi:MAG: RluA family pseudouridine synthase, partial [Tissierellia bacterium]|nr:RluA family pseudouridine synthase [Tissierellia bacterium]
IVHRLDKDTSGLLIVAKNDEAHIALAKQLKERRVKRVYWALVYGVVDIDEGTINAPIGRHPVDRKRMAVTDKNSKEAITHFKVLERFKDYTLIEATLETGRTHQIRVHMAYIKHPIVGDQVYTRRKNEFGIDSQVLHAKKLGFLHPTKDKYMEFEVEPPKYFMNIINLLRKREGR